MSVRAYPEALASSPILLRRTRPRRARRKGTMHIEPVSCDIDSNHYIGSFRFPLHGPSLQIRTSNAAQATVRDIGRADGAQCCHTG